MRNLSYLSHAETAEKKSLFLVSYKVLLTPNTRNYYLRLPWNQCQTVRAMRPSQV